jgi:hypothetical protein
MNRVGLAKAAVATESAKGAHLPKLGLSRMVMNKIAEALLISILVIAMAVAVILSG